MGEPPFPTKGGGILRSIDLCSVYVCTKCGMSQACMKLGRPRVMRTCRQAKWDKVTSVWGEDDHAIDLGGEVEVEGGEAK